MFNTHRAYSCSRGSTIVTLRPLIAATVFIALSSPAKAMQSGAGVSLGKLTVPAETMAAHCLTMVSPQYPQTAAPLKPSTVVVRVVISKSGTVSPVRVLSGEPSLETGAMNAVRLWRYRPFMRDDEPIAVSTDVRVDFDPAKAGGLVTHPKR
jgi:TonB family protein